MLKPVTTIHVFLIRNFQFLHSNALAEAIRNHLEWLVYDQVAFLGMSTCASAVHASYRHTRASNSAALGSRFGSETDRLPWTHLGLIGFSQKLFTGNPPATLRTPCWCVFTR